MQGGKVTSEYEAMPDLELVKQLQGGDMAPFRAIYARYYGCVRRYCEEIVHDEKIAEDLTQETFIKVLVKVHHFNPYGDHASFRGWIMTLAFSLAVNYLRRESKRRDLERCALEQGKIGSNPEPRAEQELHKKEFKSALWDAIKGLPEPARQCFACHYILGIHYKDLCRVYGLRQNQVAHLISSGRRRLAKELRKYV